MTDSESRPALVRAVEDARAEFFNPPVRGKRPQAYNVRRDAVLAAERALAQHDAAARAEGGGR